MVSVVLSEATRNISVPPGLDASPSEGLPQRLIAPMHDYVRRVNFTNKPRL